MVAYEIRAALPGDEEQLLGVARHLDSVNLPNDPAAIREIVEASHRSFTGQTEERQRQYVFVLIDRVKQQIVGTSMIVAQLGRRGAPYIYLDVLDEEKYSATIDKHFHHAVLRIGYGSLYLVFLLHEYPKHDALWGPDAPWTPALKCSLA